jgi:hypothetical protein
MAKKKGGGKRCESYEGFFWEGGENGPRSPHNEEKKSKVTKFREYVPTSHQIARGILNFSTSPPFGLWPCPLVHDCPTQIYFTNLRRKRC